MEYSHEKVLAHWNDENVESMYDKHLLESEINLITKRIREGDKILDAGCGEGEGTLAYAQIPGCRIHGVDFSDTRLVKARARLQGYDNVVFQKVDFTETYQLDKDFDVVVSQRFLINITDWELQKRILLGLMSLLKIGGRLLLLEGSVQGVDELNAFRSRLGLAAIPVQWHNLFLDDQKLVPFMKEHGFGLVEEDGLGVYFSLTRGIRPVLDTNLNWDCEFNKVSANPAVRDLFGLKHTCSRLKLWVFSK